MGFKKLPENRGMIYVPECPAGRRKNPCADCFSCQWCANERCRVCRGKKPAEIQRLGNSSEKKKYIRR